MAAAAGVTVLTARLAVPFKKDMNPPWSTLPLE